MAGSGSEVRAMEIDVEALLADLATMVGFASVGGSAGEVAIQEWCAGRLADLGGAVDRWEIDPDRATRSPGFPGMEVPRERAVGVAAGWGYRAPRLILCGHTDVVPPGDLGAWTRDPFTMVVEDGVAYGRGTCDMLGGVAAMLAAIRALAAAGHPMDGLAVHTVSGEEDGGLGAWETVRRGHRGAACVIAEPTHGDLVVANGGALTFRLEIPGLATHGATPRRGVSAVDKLGPLLGALADLERRRSGDPDPVMAHLEVPYPISVGTVHAGDWASTVPDLAVVEGRHGVRLDEDVSDARHALEQAVRDAAEADPWLRDNPVRVSWPGGEFAPGRLPAGDPLAGEVADAVAATGAPRPHAVGAPYGSDLRHYAAVGIPTLQYGPGDVGVAHAADEHVPVPDLVRCAQTYALLVSGRCGAAAP